MKRRTVYFLAVVGAWICGISIYSARERFIHPFPFWTALNTWYEELPCAVLGATVVVACLVYDHRRFRRKPDEAAIEAGARWRNRPELRAVLYCIAAISLASLPLGLIKEFNWLHRNPYRGSDTFLSEFPVQSIFQFAIGVAVIVYDRRRLRREAREDPSFCRACGYDLRATPRPLPRMREAGCTDYGLVDWGGRSGALFV